MTSNENKGIAKRLLQAQGDNELAVILKDTETFFGHSYTIESLYMKLQKVLNKHGIILEYNIVESTRPNLEYFPIKGKDSKGNINESFVELTKTTKKVISDKEVVNRMLVDKDSKEESITEKEIKILSKTVVFYNFEGYWINADNKDDKISFKFPIPVELKDQMSFEQAFGSAATYCFRTNLSRQFFIPTPDKDADFTTAPEEVKESLKSKIKDNEFSQLYNDIVKLNNKHPFVIEKENHFMTKLKPIFGDCNSFYEYLKFKYKDAVKDVSSRVQFKKDLQKIYNEIINKV